MRELNLFDSIDLNGMIRKRVELFSFYFRKSTLIHFHKFQLSIKAQLVFRLPNAATKVKHFPSVLGEFLIQIMGFFAVEDYIHHTTKNIGSNVLPDTDDFSSLVSREWLEKLMSTAVSKIIMLIRNRVEDSSPYLE